MFNGVIDEVRRYKKQKRTGEQKLVSLLVAPKGVLMNCSTIRQSSPTSHSSVRSPSFSDEQFERTLLDRASRRVHRRMNKSVD